jgi:hypothetical protein
MAIKVPKQQVKEQIPSGSYPARCYQMIHIGTIPSTWEGTTRMRNLIRITFELPTEMKVFDKAKGEQPMSISQEYTLSLMEKSKLKPALEGWRGKKFTDSEIEEFDITKLVGVPAMISIIHNERGYAEISSISKLPKGMECPEQINPSQILDYDNWDDKLFERLPIFLRDKIKTSEEYKKMKGITNDEIPVIDDGSPDDIDIKDIPF